MKINLNSWRFIPGKSIFYGVLIWNRKFLLNMSGVNIIFASERTFLALLLLIFFANFFFSFHWGWFASSLKVFTFILAVKSLLNFYLYHIFFSYWVQKERFSKLEFLKCFQEIRHFAYKWKLSLRLGLRGILCLVEQNEECWILKYVSVLISSIYISTYRRSEVLFDVAEKTTKDIERMYWIKRFTIPNNVEI